jgi:glutamyl-tRNA(Gln) amidotransferase subunit E
VSGAGHDPSDAAYYAALGFRAGLEIHQQLDTSKLFCACPSRLHEEVGHAFRRRLAPTQSELGEVDAAALAEARKRFLFTYESNEGSCMVEADEEPPHSVNPEALRVALLVARLLGARPVDEVHYMRKIVIDGSNTTGFQRTALLARAGAVEGEDFRVGVDGMWLEEDAARRMDAADEEGAGGGRAANASGGDAADGGMRATFRLDRLGIPLVEIATAPDVRTPAEMRRVAERIGTLLRATRWVRRGLGTIRQDLNVSIAEGARAEIKGVQDLRRIPEYVAEEVERQRGLVAVRDELRRRGVGAEDVPREPVRLDHALGSSQSRVLQGALGKGGVVLGVRLPGFAGLLRGEPVDGVRRRLGAELAAYAGAYGLRGVFHSDELPAYGVTAEEVAAVRLALRCGEGDAFVLAAGDEAVVSAAIDAVAVRAAMATSLLPREVRGAQPDGTTRYMRPLPGAARMYPETDVPPVRLTGALLAEVGAIQVELPEQWVARVSAKHAFSPAQAWQLLNRGQDAEFEALVARHDPRLVGRALLSVLPELEKEGVDTAGATLDVLDDVLSGVLGGLYSKEAVGDVLRRMLAGGMGAAAAARSLGFEGGEDLGSVRARIAAIVAERADFVRRRGADAVGPLMGAVMAEFKGKVDGKALSAMLAEAIDAELARGAK